MKCQFCGAPLDESFKFCTRCGKENSAYGGGNIQASEASDKSEGHPAAVPSVNENNTASAGSAAQNNSGDPIQNQVSPQPQNMPYNGPQAPQPSHMPYNGQQPPPSHMPYNGQQPPPSHMPYNGQQPPQPSHMPYNGQQPPQPVNISYEGQQMPAPYPGYVGAASPAKKKRLPIVIISLVVLVLLLAGGSVFAYTAYFSGTSGLYRAMANSVKVYGDELDILVDKNPVLSDAKNIFDDSFSLSTTIEEVGLSINRDEEAEIFDIEMKGELSPGADLDMRFYFTKDQFVVGAENLFYTHSAYKELPQQLLSFFENNDLGISDSDLDSFRDSLREPVDDLEAETKRQQEEITNLFRSYIEAADFSKESDSISIGGKESSCTRYNFCYNSKALINWAESDFDEFLNSGTYFADSMINFITTTGTDGTKSLTADDIIEDLLIELKDLPADFKLDVYFIVYKNVIVSMGFEEQSEEAGMSLSAVGGDYRLNHIILDLDDSYGGSGVVIKGNHIGSAHVESELIFIDSTDYDDSYSVSWDTEKQANNLKIVNYFDGEIYDEFSYTFASNGDKVLFDIADDAKFTLSALDSPLKLPENSIPLAELNIEDLYSNIFGSEFGQSIF